jgi:hypothetical protein
VDVAIAKGYAKGEKAYIAREIPGQVQSLMYAVEQAVITTFNSTVSAVANAMFVSGTGTGTNVSTSVYAIRSNGEKEVAIVVGNDGEVSVGDTTVTSVLDGSSNSFSSYLTPVGSYFATQVGSIYSIGRLGNLTTAAGLTDAKIAALLNLAPADRPFTHLVMNRKSLGQLQAARTATNPTGQPAPFPESAFNVPIIVTDAITSTQATVV